MYRRVPQALVWLAVLLLLIQGVSAQTGQNTRVTTKDIITAINSDPDPFFAEVRGPADVLQQNEPSIAQNPNYPDMLAVGVNDVRTLGISDDAWQGLHISLDGGRTWPESLQSLVPGFPKDPGCLTSPSTLAVCGNEAASDPWLGFDTKDHLFYAFIAFQRTPPGRPDFDRQDTNVIAVAKYNVIGTSVTHNKTVVVERGTVGLGRQEDKEAMAIDTNLPSSSPFSGNIYICWARFTGFQDHLKVARSDDEGESYALSEVAAASNMQGCALAVAPNGDVYVSWRTFDPNPSRSNPQDSAIFVARSTDGGATFGQPVRVATFVDYRQNAGRTPPRFRTFALTFLAVDANGVAGANAVYVAWQEKVPGVGAQARVSRSTDGGQTWEAPVEPHQIDVGHQIMPALYVTGNVISAVWYDSRSEPAFSPNGPVTGDCPVNATDGRRCRGIEVFYSQARTDQGPLVFQAERRVTNRPFNPNLFATIKAVNPFIGDYIFVVADNRSAYVVWADNRDINPTLNALEDTDVTTDPSEIINRRSRDSNVYFAKISK